MHNLRYIFTLLMLCTLFVSCRKSDANVSEDQFTETIYRPEYASGFSIRRIPGKAGILITSTNPWQGADSLSCSLFIAPDGEMPPQGFKGQILNKEAKRIVTMSSTNIAMLDVLGETDRICGVSGMRFISNPRIRQRAGEIGDVGYDGNTNYELLLSLRPDLVLLYGVDGANPIEGKLKELEIPYVYIGDYMEESPLGKAEWIVPIATIIGDMQKGIETFRPIPQRYNRLKGMVANLQDKNRPGILVNAPYAGSWFMPTSESYSGRLIIDAGGRLLSANNGRATALPVDMEEAYKMASEADLWINPGTVSSLSALRQMCPKYADTPCLRDGKVYNNNLCSNPEGGNDYFESGIMHPDLVLSDLIKIFHPDLLPEEPFHYYRRLE